MQHFLITNRETFFDDKGRECIKENGIEPASELFRIAQYNPVTRDFDLIPDTPPNLQIDYAVVFEKIKPQLPTLTGSTRLFLELYETMSSVAGGDVLLYIHGFNNDMNAVRHAMVELIEKYTGPNSPVKQIIIFSWPSRNNILYRDDFRDAKVSGYALGRAAQKYGQFQEQFFQINPASGKRLNEPCRHSLHLMAHSMGNFVLQSMVVELGRVLWQTAIFDQVILTAADINNDVFDKTEALYNLNSYCKRTHCYFNSNDHALFVSSTTKNPMNRLGSSGPKNALNVPVNINSIDVTLVAPVGASIMEQIAGHSYHLSSANVISDMLAVLAGQRTESIQSRTYVPHKNVYRLDPIPTKTRKVVHV